MDSQNRATSARWAQLGNRQAQRALREAALNGVKDFADEYIKTASMLKERIAEMKPLLHDGTINPHGLNQVERREWLERIEDIDKLASLKRRGPTADIKGLISKNVANMKDFGQWLDSSGIGSEAAKSLAKVVAPGVGPLVVQGLFTGMELIHSGAETYLTAAEAQQARENLAQMKAAYGRNVDLRDSHRQVLTSEACAPKPPARTQHRRDQFRRLIWRHRHHLNLSRVRRKTLTGTAVTARAVDGGIGAGTIAGYAAAGTGAIVGAKMLSDYSQKMKCTQYQTEMNTRMNSVVNAANSLIACSTVSCINSREPALNSALSAMLTTAGNWCTCLGPEAVSELSPEDKAMVRDLFNDLRSAGISAGSLPACFR